MTRSGEHQTHKPKSETEEWKLAKACTPEQADVFFPERGADADTAKRICAGCTVRRECLTYALTPPVERYGIWGGTSGNERRRLTVAGITNRPLPPIRYAADAIASMVANRGRNAGRFTRTAPKPATRKPRPKAEQITHGTNAGYQAHLRRLEIACDECREAHRAKARDEYLRSKARRAADREAIAATVVEIGPRRTTGRILEGATS